MAGLDIIGSPQNVVRLDDWKRDFTNAVGHLLYDPDGPGYGRHRCCFPLYSSLKFISVDSWHDFIDRPLEVAVVWAYGNWVGRLAAACLSAKRKDATIVLPQQLCWRCAELTVKDFIDRNDPGTKFTDLVIRLGIG